MLLKHYTVFGIRALAVEEALFGKGSKFTELTCVFAASIRLVKNVSRPMALYNAGHWLIRCLDSGESVIICGKSWNVGAVCLERGRAYSGSKSATANWRPSRSASLPDGSSKLIGSA